MVRKVIMPHTRIL